MIYIIAGYFAGLLLCIPMAVKVSGTLFCCSPFRAAVSTVIFLMLWPLPIYMIHCLFVANWVYKYVEKGRILRGKTPEE